MQIDFSQLPSWFMAIAILVLCAYTGFSLKNERDDRQVERRDLKKCLEDLFKRTADQDRRLSWLEGSHEANHNKRHTDYHVERET